MKLLTLKMNVIFQMRTQNFLSGPKYTGARTPGSPEPETRLTGLTLSSPSRPASQKILDSACTGLPVPAGSFSNAGSPSSLFPDWPQNR